MLGIIFGPYIDPSDVHGSVLYDENFLSFRNFDGIDLLQEPSIYTSVQNIGTQVRMPIEQFMSTRPISSVPADYEVFLYSFFGAVAQFLELASGFEKVCYGFISSGIYPCLAHSRALSERASFLELRSIYTRYYNKAASDKDLRKCAGLILEDSHISHSEMTEVIKRDAYKGHIFVKDTRGENTFLLCGHSAKLKKLRTEDDFGKSNTKFSHIFPALSSHTPLCKSWVNPRKIKNIRFETNHKPVLANDNFLENIGELDGRKRVNLIDQQIRGPMFTYRDYLAIKKIAKKITFIGGKQTATIAKTFLRHESEKGNIQFL